MYRTLSPTELVSSIIYFLCKEIGVVNTARFINQFSTGYGNYTEERDSIIGDLTVDEIVEEIKRKRLNKK